jgi:hypothetical protein
MVKTLSVIAISLIPCVSMAQEIGCGVSVIPDSQIKRGCGSGYYIQLDKKKLKTIFQAGLDSSDNPRMYIDGALVDLVAFPANRENTYSEAGNQFSETYQYENMSIRFDNTVSTACTVENEICEVVSFDTTMTLSSDSCSIEVENVRGDCGC